MPPRSQHYLDCRAQFALIFYRDGKITEEESERLLRDARLGVDTGDVVFLPQNEWRWAKAVADAKLESLRRQKKGGL